MRMASDGSTSTGQAAEGRRVVARSTVLPAMTADDTTLGDEHDSIATGPGVTEHRGRDFDGLGRVELPCEGATEATVELTSHSWDGATDDLVLRVGAGGATLTVTLEGDDRLAFLDEVHRLVMETGETEY